MLRVSFLGVLIAALPLSAAAPPQKAKQRSESFVHAKAVAGKIGDDRRQVVTITLEIDPDHYLIGNPAGVADLEYSQVTVRISGKGSPRVLKLEYPEGEIVKWDKLIGDYRIYKGRVTIRAVVERAKGDDAPLSIAVGVFAFHAWGLRCYVPATLRLSVP